jgi:serpin B
MSAEITEGNSQRQITALLGLEDLETIRQTAKNIWELSYMDNGKSKVIPSASLWLNVAETYKKSVIELLAKNYYASVFGGDPASGEYVERLRKWLNDHTDGLLKDYVSKIKMSPAMIITLASTLNFSGAWREKFNESKTNEDVFHTPDGDVKCDFMHTEKTSYNFGKKFSSVSFMMDNGCKMITILPDEGVTCEELLRDSEALACLSGKTLYYDIKRTHISIPKFDISSSMELEGALKALGVALLYCLSPRTSRLQVSLHATAGSSEPPILVHLILILLWSTFRVTTRTVSACSTTELIWSCPRSLFRSTSCRHASPSSRAATMYAS